MEWNWLSPPPLGQLIGYYTSNASCRLEEKRAPICEAEKVEQEALGYSSEGEPTCLLGKVFTPSAPQIPYLNTRNGNSSMWGCEDSSEIVHVMLLLFNSPMKALYHMKVSRREMGYFVR